MERPRWPKREGEERATRRERGGEPKSEKNYTVLSSLPPSLSPSLPPSRPLTVSTCMFMSRARARRSVIPVRVFKVQTSGGRKVCERGEFFFSLLLFTVHLSFNPSFSLSFVCPSAASVLLTLSTFHSGVRARPSADGGRCNFVTVPAFCLWACLLVHPSLLLSKIS